MRKFVKMISTIVFTVTTMLAGAATNPATADDPAFLTIAAGAWDFNKNDDQGAEFRLEYRSDYKLWELKPFGAIAASSTGSAFIGAGVLMDIYFGRRFVVTPSFAPHFYAQGGSDKDLGHVIEFRSQLEFAYRFDDRSRLGLSVSHYSNASLGDRNPGTESLLLNYSIPIN
ncbi:MAG: acyloxyacyl hydrolase [Rhodospirillales bacterium]|nr:acyloxyacyl hydrolase [Rhodospirillales bacterium]